MSEDETREEVIVEIAEVFDSVLSAPLGGIVGGGTPPPNETSDTPPLRAVYTAVAEDWLTMYNMNALSALTLYSDSRV